jgi:hypothetical protein
MASDSAADHLEPDEPTLDADRALPREGPPSYEVAFDRPADGRLQGTWCRRPDVDATASAA